MGKTPQPVTILLIGMVKGPELEELEAMGHRVMELPDIEADIILGPSCWRILPQHMKFLPLALKEARAAAKVAKPKKSHA